MKLRSQVRQHTPPEINEKIDHDTDIRVHYYAGQSDEEISRRIHELENERNLERLLEANAATVSLLGLVLGIAFTRRWLLLPMIVGGFLFNHAVRGWCPPVSVMRRMGVRTQREIDRETYLLKALLGDFEEIKKSRAAKSR